MIRATSTPPATGTPSLPIGKLYIKTYGCQMNVYDSEKMALVLRSHADHPLELTDNPEEADVILFNTCSIREKAADKLFSELGRFKVYKRQKPHLIMGVGGCVASQEGAEIFKKAPYVDVVFGPQTLHRLPELIHAARATRKSQIDISFPEIEKFDKLPTPQADGVTAYVSIMEGCSKYCTYCVVPYTRGTEISRPLRDVIHEVHALVQQGVQEITFLGQNVNAYQGPVGDGTCADLALLIETVAHLPNLKRIRFTTSHPTEFSDRLIQAYAQVPQLVDHLHLPVQSGSDRILAAMKRGYTILELKSKIRKLKKIRPHLTWSSDFIVGFPGETESDFQKTLDLVKELECDQSFCFIFSPRPGTPAATLPDETPLEIKKDRLYRLQTLLTEQARAISTRMIGTVVPVLVTGPSERNPQIWSSRTENNRLVHFTAPDTVLHQVVQVRIEDVKLHSLVGTYVGA